MSCNNWLIWTICLSMIVTRLRITLSFAKTLILGFMLMECFFSPHRLHGLFGLDPKHKDRQLKLGCNSWWRRQARKTVTCAATAQRNRNGIRTCPALNMILPALCKHLKMVV